MDFIVEILAELIITPVVELYALAMMHIFGRKIRKDKIKVIVVLTLQKQANTDLLCVIKSMGKTVGDNHSRVLRFFQRPL